MSSERKRKLVRIIPTWVVWIGDNHSFHFSNQEDAFKYLRKYGDPINIKGPSHAIHTVIPGCYALYDSTADKVAGIHNYYHFKPSFVQYYLYDREIIKTIPKLEQHRLNTLKYVWKSLMESNPECLGPNPYQLYLEALSDPDAFILTRKHAQTTLIAVGAQ